MALDQNIGMVTAYAYAVSKGYTGTEEQFAQELASAGADLSQIQTQIDNFINTIVPAKTAEVTAEGTRQIGLVAAEGTAQKNAVTAEGTTQKNAVISEGTTQKNAVNSAGSTQVNAVNSAGSTQVGNVNTAGSTQVGAVQAKGQEVINSIPSDYTALSDDVDDLKSAFSNYNLFNKRTASIISVMGNSSGGLVGGGGVSSVAIPCEPNTEYTVSFWGGNRRILWETEAYPVTGGTWLVNDGELFVTSETVDGKSRYKKTITTSASTHYLLLYFYTNASGAEDVINTVQLEKGSEMHEYGAYDMPQLQIMTSQFFEDKYVANILGYRALGALDKGYICLVADDGTSDIANVSFAIAQNKNVPITFALWSTSACVTDSTLRTQLLDMVANHGCSVAQHGEGYFTDYTTDQLIEYLESEKNAFNAFGINTKGIVYPNHAHNGTVRAVCGSMYDVCCTGGASANKDHVYANDTLGTRSNQFALYRVSTYSTTEATLKASCDYAYDNNKLLIIWWHDNDVAGESAQLTKINNVIDYAKAKGLEFVTVGEIPYL